VQVVPSGPGFAVQEVRPDPEGGLLVRVRVVRRDALLPHVAEDPVRGPRAARVSGAGRERLCNDLLSAVPRRRNELDVGRRSNGVRNATAVGPALTAAVIGLRSRRWRRMIGRGLLLLRRRAADREELADDAGALLLGLVRLVGEQELQQLD